MNIIIYKMTENKFVGMLYKYCSSFFEYMKNHDLLRNLISYGLMFSLMTGFLPFSVLFNFAYFGLFLFSSREVLRHYTLMLTKSTEQVNFLQVVYMWSGLYFLSAFHSFLYLFVNLLNSYVLGFLVNTGYLYFLIKLIKSLETGMVTYQINETLKLVSKVNLFENQETNAFNKLINASVDFYRVNMKLYDFLVLNKTLSTMCYISNSMYENMNSSVSFVSDKYHNVTELLKTKVMGTKSNNNGLIEVPLTTVSVSDTTVTASAPTLDESQKKRE
jgi:hypothetical protein